MTSIVNNKTNPFRLEDLRDLWAKNKMLKKFKNSYKVHSDRIRATNTETFWNRNISRGIASANTDNVTRQKISFVCNHLSGMNGKLLDVGAGYLDLEMLLDKKNSKLMIYGIDISSYAVNQAKKLGLGEFKKGSILKIPYGRENFDFVCSLDVLEHISPNQTFKALKEVNRVLKRFGKLIISVPLNEKLEEMVKTGVNPNGHLRVYTPNILKTELQISGFKVRSEKYIFAFKKFYFIKSIIAKLLPKLRNPNLLIIIAEKV